MSLNGVLLITGEMPFSAKVVRVMFEMPATSLNERSVVLIELLAKLLKHQKILHPLRTLLFGGAISAIQNSSRKLVNSIAKLFQ